MKMIFLSWSLAVRNLWLLRRKTVSTVATIVIGLLGLTMLDGFITASMDGFRDAVIQSGTGHFQVVLSPQAFDQGDTNPLPFLFPDQQGVESALRALPGVKDVLPSLSFAATVSTGKKTHYVQVSAFSTASAVSELKGLSIAAGHALEPDKPGRILMGTGLARLLKVAPGAEVSVFALSQGGGINTVSFTVEGITSSKSKELDDRSVNMDLADAQTLIGAPKASKLVVFLKHTLETKAAVDAVRDSPGPLAGLEVRSWDQLTPSFQQANGLLQMILAVARFVVLMVALLSISGTLSLSVIERYRELGTLRAFGTKRRQILTMLIQEGVVMGVVGTLFGSLLAWSLIAAINGEGGMTFPAEPGMSVDTIKVLFTPDLGNALANAIALIVASALAALLPGMLSFRRNTAELLRS
jgi:putative ABC transport system permease protein